MSYVLLVLTTLFWSGNFVISRGMHAEIPPFSLAFWRWVAAFAILSFFAVKHLWRERELAKKHYRFICIQGLVGVAGFNTLIYLAMQTTTAINAVLVNSCIPVLIAVCSWVFYREMMTVRQCFGVLVSLSGVVLIISRGELAHLLAVSFNQGDLLVLFAALLWAIYSANLKRYPQGLHPMAYQSGIVLFGVLVLVPFYGYELVSGKAMQVSVASVGTILYVALFASVLAFIFWNRAVRTVGANKAGPFIHLMPVFSTILAVIFLGEKIQSYHLQGIVMIFIGIAMTTFRVGRREARG
ncbi:DMT family transporter [Desulfopila aestuarii]|uniref:Permease of the drug/metabolite transporter (DMT) superfamily n=1 Tax=Desulfopila aestuarii DSM 18488 TaxID=1121416 RepID=A0A1M7Y324_9BACT|nr:DMT family transporter [Desulfopila aestuarii]SHO46386.1 Permease of the drug/metabolite transporter (DMT) superfamily [Desulfopila aestuarii DSM 18488]